MIVTSNVVTMVKVIGLKLKSDKLCKLKLISISMKVELEPLEIPTLIVWLMLKILIYSVKGRSEIEFILL